LEENRGHDTDNRAENGQAMEILKSIGMPRPATIFLAPMLFEFSATISVSRLLLRCVVFQEWISENDFMI